MKTAGSVKLRVLIFVYIVAKPFYIWDSGLPQIADVILLIFVAIVVLEVISKRRARLKNGGLLGIALLFLYYIILVNVIWYLALGTGNGFLATILYYIFNISALASVVVASDRLRVHFFSTIYRAVVVSSIVQVAIYILSESLNTGRASNFFNNPNQLGYYALLCMAFLFILEKEVRYHRFVFALSVASCYFLIFVSVSKAAMVSAVLMFAVFALTMRMRGYFRSFSLVFAGLSIAFVYSIVVGMDFLYGRSVILDSSLLRIQQSSGTISFVEGRGYDRIVNQPHYLIFGAGEGELGHVDSFLPLELHSTLGTVLYSYGFIGFGIFLLFVINVVRKSGLHYAYPVIFLFLYGLTHNGMRNSLLWITFAILIIVAQHRCDRDDRPPPDQGSPLRSPAKLATSGAAGGRVRLADRSDVDPQASGPRGLFIGISRYEGRRNCQEIAK